MSPIYMTAPPSTIIKTLENPGPGELRFSVGTVLQTAPPLLRAFVFTAPFAGDSNEGRVYYMPFTGLPKSAHLTALAKIASAFRLQITGEPGRRFEIQATTDFISWEPADTITITDNQPLVVDDSAAGNQTSRFYRAVQLQ